MQPFDILPFSVQKILLKLEERDRKERKAGLDRLKRLRQIPRETGEFLYQFLSIFSLKRPNFLGLEIGTSGGYSTLWQGMALVMNGYGRLISLDHDPIKYQLASKNVALTEVSQFVDLIHGDAKDYLKSLKSQDYFNYIFMDCEKEDYFYFFDFLVNRLVPGTVLIADNVISHANYMEEFIKQIKDNSKVSSVILPVGRGLALIRWI
jgi:caffeoyl-CoA O-methyltransferase